MALEFKEFRNKAQGARGTARIAGGGAGTVGVGPVGTAVGKAAYGCENKLLFGRNTPQIAIFMAVPPFLSSYNQTGGSDVRGKAVPNWVRKIFNCLRSL
jgi:hypothetical protein